MFPLLLLAAAEPAPPPPSPEPETVVVRAERLETGAAVSAIGLGSDVIAASGAVRLDEALRLVPGAGLFRRSSSGVANATIQGLSLRPIAPNGAGRALVSVDGVPLNDPFGGWINWARLDPLFVERVDVLRGGAASGLGALTGALDVSEWRGGPSALRLGVGGQGERRVAARASLGDRAGTLTLQGAHDRSDGAVLIDPAQAGAVDTPAGWQATSLGAVAEIALGEGGLSARGSVFEESKEAGILDAGSLTRGADASLAWRFANGRVIVWGQERDFRSLTLSVAPGRAGATPAVSQDATPAQAVGASVLVRPGQGWPRIGLDVRRAEGETRERFRFQGGGFTRTRVAGGAQETAGLGLDWGRGARFGSVDVGGWVRLDAWRNSGARRLERDSATGAVTLVDSPDDKDRVIVTGSIRVTRPESGLGFQAYRTARVPSLNELHRPFRVGNDVTEANAGLKPETLAGLDVDWQGRAGLWSWSATAWVNRLSDPVANVTEGTGPGVFPRTGFLPAGGAWRVRRNAGRVDAAGLEGRLQWASADGRLGAAFAVSVSEAEVDGGVLLPQLTGKRPAQTARHAGSLSAHWQGKETAMGVPRIDVMVRAEGERFEDDLNLRKLDPYAALDLAASWRLAGGGAVSLSMENALNADIPVALSGDGVLSLTGPRTIRLGWSWSPAR